VAKNCTSTNHLPDKLDICASGNVAVYLKTKVATHQYHKIYFDNFCMPVPVMLYPYGEGTLTFGTDRHNRVPDCKLPSESDVKNDPHGTAYEYVAVFDNGKDLTTLCGNTVNVLYYCIHFKV
jgi:hypothetical protein